MYMHIPIKIIFLKSLAFFENLSIINRNLVNELRLLLLWNKIFFSGIFENERLVIKEKKVVDKQSIDYITILVYEY